VTTLSLVAHQDDDLLFMSPDIPSDIQAGDSTWIAYLTAGNLDPGPAGMPYADRRIQGLRAAYARAAKVANVWSFQLISLPSGRRLASNFLRDAPHVHLVFTFINAANGPDDGDLSRMWHNAAFVAAPIDGRPSYTQGQFIAMLRELIGFVKPDFLRVADPAGMELADHIDHAYAGKFAALANSNAAGKAVLRMDGYFGYCIRGFPENFPGYWQSEKLAIWSAYKPFDSAFPPGSTAWNEVSGRQFRRHVWFPGDTWFDL
jgi:LmbE family N-acetylglucosaminyl deacetylase